MSIHFHKAASDELAEAIAFYETQQEQLGDRFLIAARQAVDQIIDFPDRFRQIEPGIRKCRIASFPYGVIYQTVGTDIHIIAIMHLHRDPGYWRHRKVPG